MAMDTTDILEWAIGGITVAGASIMGYLNLKTNKMQEDHIKHVLYVQETYAKSADVAAGFASAAKVAENFGKDLNAKVDKTQEAVHRVEVVQAAQSENIKNMDKNLEAIVKNTIKDKAE